ncbi:MAG: NAD(P)-dependent oxidoreductase [Jatrophihabitans sp.]|uniref:NAD(P)-dependent oxidoreductase n=1 Tax=Jatrophihabitans sp. TaxID=1932789 RepID=UPI003F7F830D
MRVTVLGLGRMGAALASRLTDHDLTVWNRSSGKAGDLVDAGAHEADSVEAAVADAEVVFSSLTGDDAVRSVLLPDGAALPTDGVVVDCSTISPALADDLARAYPGRFAAGPIAGAPPALRDGKATWILAGPDDVFERLTPVLDAVTATRLRVGTEVSAAAQVKLLNNYVMLGNLAVLADAIAAAQQIGLSDETLQDVLGQLPVVAPGIAVRIPKLLGSDHDPAFTVALGRKDLGLFGDVFGRTDLTRCVETAYAGADDDLDVSAVVDPIRSAERG